MNFILLSIDINVGNDIWKGRTAVFISTLLPVLETVIEKFKYNFETNPTLLKKRLDLKTIGYLREETGNKGLENYLLNLPAYIDGKRIQEQSPKVFEIHCFIIMQINFSLDSIIEKYSYEDNNETIIRSENVKRKLENF